MESLEQMQAAAFEIIAYAGEARSDFVEAIREARHENFEHAWKLIQSGQEKYAKIHLVHASLIQREAGGEQLPFSLLLMHAEDQMLTTETIKIMAIEMLEMYKKMSTMGAGREASV
ncbi:PTS lactose/cellobiose transporter subunit IIA [Brevibacillus migulae]|uniref:PTS lactose/cellobiose transporter subunit IIA n=1 Tax=Brevibacillus migulae TaxID=1644114 RepID=UPI00106E87E6|nr:PTS lactose/cellobiose transporter subunit IIA [Brevibacillus migulae]